ncbi:MAG: STAS domain-containing protein [Bacteroidales bacterium]|jgi:anti-anti-sigma regulatory factor|nr:STAS domain-containing protein [Bacteroidales bacterium]
MYDQEIITIEQLHDESIITFYIKKINIINTKEIEVMLTDIMDITESNLILDLSNVIFIDSSGFDMLDKIKLKSYVLDVEIKYINISTELEDLINFINRN